MPKPIYMICCQSASEDKLTNLASYFLVLERLHIFKTLKPNAGERLFAFRIIAAWLKQPGDDDIEFDWEMLVELPQSRAVRDLAKGKFTFTKDSHIFRCNVNYEGPPPVDGSGMLILRCRVRPSEGGDWMVQEYPLIIEEMNPATTVGNVPAPA